MRTQALVLLTGLTVLAGLVPSLPAAERVFEPAPEISETALDVARLQKAIDRLRGQMGFAPPSTAGALNELFTDFGNDVGLWTDVATVSNEVRGLEFVPALNTGLERFGLAFAAVSCLRKQLVDGKPAGIDLAYESFKFLLSKAPLGLGVYAGVLGIVKWGLDRVGSHAVAIVDQKFYDEYRAYCLREYPTADQWLALFADPNGTGLRDAMQKFWTDPETHGLRGNFLLEGQDPQYRQAMTDRVLRDLILPMIRGRLEDLLWEAECELVLRTQAEVAGFFKREVVVVVPTIVNECSGLPARDLTARLVYDSKFLLAECPVQGRGARFAFPAGKLLDPTTKRPRTSLYLYLTPRPPAVLSGREWSESLNLTAVRPRIRRVYGDTSTTYSFEKPIVTDVRYEVTVDVDGAASSLKAESTYAAASSFSAIHATRTTYGVRQGSSFLFKDLPAGPCTFVSDQGKAGEATITGPTRLTLSVQPPQATPTTEAPRVDAPDFAAPLQAQLGLLQGLRTYGTAAADLWARAQAIKADLCRRTVIMEAEFTAARKLMEAKRAAVQAMDRGKPDSPEKDALSNQARLEEQALWQAEREAKKGRDEARKAFEEGLRTLNKQVSDDGSRMNAERRDAERELRETVDAARREADEANRAIEEVFREDGYDGTWGLTAAAADAKMAGLEATVADLEARLARVGELATAAAAHRTRLDGILSQLSLRATALDEDIPVLPKAAAGLERLQALVRLLKEQRAADLTARAMGSIKRRHAARRRNAAELARLMAEAQTLAGALPAVDATLFEATTAAFVGRLTALLSSNDPATEEAARVVRELTAFLDAHALVCADLRSGSHRRETAFSRLTTIVEHYVTLLRNRAAHQVDDPNALAPVWAAWMQARDLRTRFVEPLVRLEADARAAAADLPRWRTGARAARTTLDGSLARARALLDGEAADPSTLIAALDEAWSAMGGLPSFHRPTARAHIHGLAEELARSGRLETWAESARRPLVVFTSYHDASRPGAHASPTPLDRAFFRAPAASAGSTTSHYVLKARVVGLPPGTSCMVEYGAREWLTLAHRNDDGTYTVAFSPQGEDQELRILGTGVSAPPLARPWLRQVVFE